ncbi:hypothetical protein KAU11_07850 [Candidatus Babeliales bacterium]|nr:hypothetical protein [Candidatus Babeliales bacterium]
MGLIKIKTSKFAQSSNIANVNKTINVSKLDIIRSIITVGYIGGLHFPLNYSSEFIWRIKSFSGLLYTIEKKDNKWKLKDFTKRIDKSNKAIISYHYGMVFTKLVAEKIMNIPWLRNIDEMIMIGDATISNGTSKRGDLAGLDNHYNWHVIESKGRSNTPEKGLMKKAKNQSKKIIKIQGKPPFTASGSIVSLSPHPIKVEIEDPPIDKYGKELNFENSLFFEGYYRTISSLLNFYGSYVTEYNNYNYNVLNFEINNKKWEMGLLHSIHKNVGNAYEIIKDFSVKEVSEGENISIGSDGIILRIYG